MERATIRLTLLSFLLICVISAPTKKSRDLDIYSFHINSTVISRYAITVITSRVANRVNESREVHFQVKIPKNAFISKFRMTIEGKTYDGVVKQKEEAQQQYSEAVSRGESAGLVGSVGRTLEEFKTSVTVAALSKVTFELTYEELLKRRLGKYELRINAQPMQPVADFKIDVYINEHPGISFLEVKGGLKSQELSSAVISTLAASTKEAWVNFYPTREQQTKCEGCGENGLNGDLLIEYDVKRPNQNGELKASNGYFVHYFAPTDIQQIPKNVVFIIDRSGSMHGRKIDQTRTAMLKILGDLAQDDYFGLIIFDSEVDVWKAELLQATERNVKQAKDFVKKINDRGATDINAAVLKGVDMIKRYPREGSASILILLTDGQPTTGETKTDRIQANIKKAIGGKFPLYCLGFGFDVSFDFLEKMALENDGVARRIYEDSDADLQLEGFYKEVATPLLTDVQLNYIGAANLTQTSFRQYYNGSEIVVAGQITDNSLETFQTEVIAISMSSGTIRFPTGETKTDRIQANIKKAIGGKFPLYCLGFGFDVSFDFLEKMALENDGVARRIYEDSDADLQLEGFYKEVATPLLTDVQLNYIGAANLTQSSFRQYYNGSEIVVAGQITDNSLETFQTEVIAISVRSSLLLQFCSSIPVSCKSAAYLSF
ncbi:hypothetical protein PGIGA_G00116860 [Pangasianodon gigas]|uniref:Uncharacterized protein n=1 Tax=Pangasianodon gigas TaxID=30993 RepID=A0ACC5XH95_PANGG|nr:hypothetical protein [Pangasianodon gigas]